ncbi:cyclin G isoform X1 [Neodiprion pinetum]|uniref:Cyclin G isoform X1 n=1 Tax=Neodiprion lecontei TaxID=441921 RepID=A0ABM3G2P9_NEOLC|nr:cyclin G isoform X1 [Neodiprion pinetum]XP_046475942.1 cyclin G isoform X1 [Neodiprion pinetum]XP_046475943.1 cyclin G isoform X1 [Neodiprion pinetum]XP_046594547.1 cyclin G isoform X1 [Neodiprion lecontei]XP_046594548.1 cyclin G isoform X1 [Neodiprion lecontei]XP_046594549.1 cyclin G isoform X1 [Neodiprion lecontei]
MDTSGSPVPDAIHPLVEQLQEALVLETKYQPNLQLPITTQNDEITIGARDGSAHVLRCLKVWYDLPSDVFFIAINLMDRFLTKMKARPKHMACISVSSFHIAAVQMAQSLDADHLVSISQCKCTGGDLKRMSEVIRNKLGWDSGVQVVTALTFLRLFNVMFHAAAGQLGLADLYANIVKESELLLRLEMVACDGNCASLRPSEVALVLLCTYLDSAVNRLDSNADATMSLAGIAGPSTSNSTVSANPAHQMLRLVDFAAELQKICKIPDESFYRTHELVGAILSKYNAQEQTPHRQRLVWRLSSRTARLLRPTDKFTSVLPAIAEHAPIPSPSRIRCGSISSSSSWSSEEEIGIDWDMDSTDGILHPIDWPIQC